MQSLSKHIHRVFPQPARILIEPNSAGHFCYHVARQVLQVRPHDRTFCIAYGPVVSLSRLESILSCFSPEGGKGVMLRIGHRGARGHAPENTLAAIECGIALQAHLVEFDVRATRDGQLVLLHDATLDRTTNGHGPIVEHLWSDVRQLTAGGGQPVPLLADALRAASGRTGVMIEIKAEGTARQICRTVQDVQFNGAVVYASYLHDELLDIRRILPAAQTLALIEAVPVNRTAFATDAQATHVGVAFDVLTSSFLTVLHDCSLRVFVYTVNEPADIQRAKAMGVDGIVSDYPERLL